MDLDRLPRRVLVHREGAVAGQLQSRNEGRRDALILASALDAGCNIVCSEDLRDGQVIDGRVTIRNPFQPG